MEAEGLESARNLVCESESVIAHRIAILGEGFILVVLWGLLIWFLSLVALGSPGSISVETWFFLALWGIATVGFTWYVAPRFRYARTRVYTDGFVLPMKKGLWEEVLVPYEEVESVLELSENRLEIKWRGREYSITRHRFDECFELLREELAKAQQRP